MRIAVILESSPFDRKGIFNAAHNRIRHLLASGECRVDVFCLYARDTAFTRMVRKTPEVPFKDSVTIDGIVYNMIWYDFSIIDNILLEKLYRKPFFTPRVMRRAASMLEGYDIITAHSYEGAVVADYVRKMYGTPYFVTWHGSDIHTHPKRNPVIRMHTKELMENAAGNFFVSEALCRDAEDIAPDAPKEVLYNGVSEMFALYESSRRTEVRASYGLSQSDKVVAYVGNFFKVKNPDVLPWIYREVAGLWRSHRRDDILKFWIVGDGKLHDKVVAGLGKAGMRVSYDIRVNAEEVAMFGNRAVEEMPDIMNCIDVLVLPSRNEGLPLVMVEALKCGANVIGTLAGGIPEVIGKEFCVSPASDSEPYGAGFVRPFAEKVVALLEKHAPQAAPAQFDWKTTAAKELDAYRTFLRLSEAES